MSIDNNVDTSIESWLEGDEPEVNTGSVTKEEEPSSEKKTPDESEIARQREKITELRKTLNDGQRTAIDSVLKKDTGLVIIEGHAGTGKTYVLKVLLESFWNRPRACLAPTHQALGQITGLHEDQSVFSTVASFFKVRRRVDADSGEELFTDPQYSDPQHLYGGFVACDEGSMLGEVEANLLLRLSEHTLVVIFRDNAQLPPVNKAKSDVDHAADEIHVLTEQMRNGDMVLALCNHFRSKTSIPRTSRGNVVIHHNRREMLNDFLDDIAENPIPGDAVYLAFTNKQMAKVRTLVTRRLFGGEEYSVGQWIRLELNDEVSRTVRSNGRESVLLNRVSLTGRITHSEPHTVRIAGETYDGYKIRLVDVNGEVLTHKPPVSEVGKLVIPEERDLFLTLGFDDLDHLQNRLKQIFNENRKLAYEIKHAALPAAQRALMKEQHERGIRFATEGQRVCVALSPYAYTVHKSQGMTIRRVYVDAANILSYSGMPKHPTKELLYVGASRTRDTLHLLA